MQKVIKKIDLLTEFIGRLSAMVLLALAALIVYDAFARYLFSTGSLMLQELEWHLFDVIILFSVAYTLKYNQHVRVDIFYQKMSPKLQKCVGQVGLIFLVLPFSLLMVYVGLDFVQISFAQMDGSPNAGGLPLRFLVKSLIFLGFVFLTLQAVSEFFQLKEGDA
jgi:TRAP-type mannitol/chloroaromatic compound transport system permease small subunit